MDDRCICFLNNTWCPLVFKQCQCTTWKMNTTLICTLWIAHVHDAQILIASRCIVSWCIVTPLVTALFWSDGLELVPGAVCRRKVWMHPGGCKVGIDTSSSQGTVHTYIHNFVLFRSAMSDEKQVTVLHPPPLPHRPHSPHVLPICLLIPTNHLFLHYHMTVTNWEGWSVKAGMFILQDLWTQEQCWNREQWPYWWHSFLPKSRTPPANTWKRLWQIYKNEVHGQDTDECVGAWLAKYTAVWFSATVIDCAAGRSTDYTTSDVNSPNLACCWCYWRGLCDSWFWITPKSSIANRFPCL